MKLLRVLCIGEPLREYVATIQSDGQISHQKFNGFAGDIVPNAATYLISAARHFHIDCQVDALIALSDDDDSKAALSELKHRGIGIHPYSQSIPGKHLGSVINLRNPDGSQAHEKVRLDRADSPFRHIFDHTTVDDFKSITHKYNLIITSSIPLACLYERKKLIELLSWIRQNQNDTKIIVGTNLRPSNWLMPDRQYPTGLTSDDDRWQNKAQYWMQQMLECADIIFANFTDEKILRQLIEPKEAVHVFRTINPKAALVITNDEHPLHILNAYHDRSKVVQLKATSTTKVIDTTGAGDCLLATTVMALESGKPLKDAVQLGSYLASQVVGFEGALPSHNLQLNYEARSILSNNN